jgi:hypothetical protein
MRGGDRRQAWLLLHPSDGSDEIDRAAIKRKGRRPWRRQNCDAEVNS